jgi:hypothetical protein
METLGTPIFNAVVPKKGNDNALMEAQRDLVDVVHALRQVVCVKG